MPEWTHTYAWGNNPTRAELKGRRCRVVATGRMGTALVEFEGGRRVTTSRRALRRVPEPIPAGDLWPRDADHRYRLYARRGDELEVLAAAPTAAGLGEAIVQLHEDEVAVGRRLADRGVIGVLDVMAGGSAGEWIVLPWERSATGGTG